MKTNARIGDSLRAGLSLMEVIFAIGVLMIGLLGIASVLPVATTDANGALRQDESLAKVENQIAVARSRVPSSRSTVLQANNVFNNGLNDYVPNQLALASPYPGNPAYNGVVCIDPWFLASANNVPPSNTPADINGYDRTLFPCYRPDFDPTQPPNAAFDGTAMGVTPSPPRFARIAIDNGNGATRPINLNARETFQQRDGLPLYQPEDTTLPPGLLVRSIAAPSVVDPNRRFATAISSTSRLSAITLMWPTSPGSEVFDVSVVVAESRNTLIDPSAPNTDQRFRLGPYNSTYAFGDDERVRTAAQETYEDEILGFVSYASLPLSAGGGEFTIQHSGFVRPRIERGGWLLLMRNHFSQATPNGVVPPGAQFPTPKFAWVKIRDIVSDARVLPGFGPNTPPVFETTVSVTGSDWVFHPCQMGVHPVTLDSNPGPMPPYGRPIGGGTVTNAPPQGQLPTAYDPGDGDIAFGTFVVILPHVISVQQSQLSL